MLLKFAAKFVERRRYSTKSELLSFNCNNNNNNAIVRHVPVMKHEVVRLFKENSCKNILDLTFGGGGHTGALLREIPGAVVYALDRDPDAHKTAVTMASTETRLKPLLGKFSEVKDVLYKTYGVQSLDGALLDVGVSSMQFDEVDRGFALSADGPLDMRMDKDRDATQLTAYDVVNHMSEANLFLIIKKYGEEKNARFIARSIVDHRYAHGAIRSTTQLAAIIANCFSNHDYKQDKLQRPAHVATKTFQAIRIFVNNELNELNQALLNVHSLLVPGGLCVAISFHSLEDRIVKRHFHGIDMREDLCLSIRDRARRNLDRDEIESIVKKNWVVENKKIIVPSDKEVTSNPRSRSAKLRYAFKARLK
ncbi:hypothetical protein HELRODRAFT_77586 [Helobdella robusta]|uniref:Uncharacterized protein n=1 Tax=Helobdella robusta TaxID=6412 RepID=T1G302_HELRO|nr:hypothetical protein HELRODRAFT_77586 [Helobdella robusta]ESO05613.1 hypothetical protein HELRODRAFT_77586 [Helobdella robusta]